MAKRKRRVHEEDVRPETRPRSLREREPAPGGPSAEVLRLQRLAGNSAVNVLMRSPTVQRDTGTAPAPADDRPKESGITIVVEDEMIGSFVAVSVQLVNAPRGGATAGKRLPNEVLVTKRSDELSPLLMQAAATGKVFPSLTVAMPGFPLVMKDVMISSFQMGGGVESFDTMVFSAKEPEEKD
ncbi:MAG: hypothetical protein ACRDGU_09125 [Actinomycetota bacterium]